MLGGWYILDGDLPREVDLETYARWREDRHKCVIARTYLSRDGLEILPRGDILRTPRKAYACVSTVFLGMDTDYAWRGPHSLPMTFETMVMLFDDHKDDSFLAPQWRYRTALAARAMHAQVVAFAQQRCRAGDDLRTVDSDDWPEE